MRGELGETVLMPARPRLPGRAALLARQRARAAPSTRRAIARFVRDADAAACSGLRVRTAALVLPGRALAQLEPARAMEWFLEESGPFAEQLDELTVLDTHDAQRAMQPLVDRARRRALTDF